MQRCVWPLNLPLWKNSHLAHLTALEWSSSKLHPATVLYINRRVLDHGHGLLDHLLIDVEHKVVKDTKQKAAEGRAAARQKAMKVVDSKKKAEEAEERWVWEMCCQLHHADA